MLNLFLFSTLQKITAQQHGLNCKLQMEEEKNINNQNMLAPNIVLLSCITTIFSL
jgi:hypothetical protein